MSSAIVVHPRFDGNWPWAADHFARLWKTQGPLEFRRLSPDDPRTVSQALDAPERVTRLAALGVPVTPEDLDRMTGLREATFDMAFRGGEGEACRRLLSERGVHVYTQPTEGYWGSSVAEFGLALTLCGLRRIPQLHRQMIADLSPWDYGPADGVGRPGARGHQFGDDPRYTSGTVEGKRVRIVGMGNIASRYASTVRHMGADVAAWDPFAGEPGFHRSGARKEWHLDRLVRDAEIFAPMLPLTDGTRGIVTRAHIEALPKGCLVVLVTRAGICDMAAVRERALADEIALAADVFDVEPLPLDDPLLGRPNVVHTPHNAGRTRRANELWAEKLAEQFLPRDG